MTPCHTPVISAPAYAFSFPRLGFALEPLPKYGFPWSNPFGSQPLASALATPRLALCLKLLVCRVDWLERPKAQLLSHGIGDAQMPASTPLPSECAGSGLVPQHA